MKKFKIISDSTHDLSPELVKEADVDIVPSNVLIGDETYLDYFEINDVLLYAKMKEKGVFPKTSAGTPAYFLKAFEKAKAEGYKEIIVITIGNSFSATQKSGMIAAEMIEGVKVRFVDSYSLSSGSGLLVMRAHDLRKEGKSVDEVADYLQNLAPRVRAQFIVDNLQMLNAGGRVTGIKYFIGRILRAHPFLQVNDAKLEVVDTPKGKSERALDKMIEVFETEFAAGLESPRVFITHTHGGSRIDYIKERLLKLIPEENIYVTEAGAVISSHCGAGTIGILYIRK
ncbi:MAG TPA: DegV family protein [Bacilli bacterium]|nr:DegV family protein [Bacilli bacterium]